MSTPSATPAPTRKAILQLLDHQYALTTPAFQRTYAWEKEQVNDYWVDLKRALDDGGGAVEYFLGLVVLDDSDAIQDGQQRLATTLLLASEMYDQVEAAKTMGSHDNQLAKDALAPITSALRTSPSAPLTISLQDQDVLLNRAGIRSDSPESAKRLAAARTQLSKNLDEDLAPLSTADARLARLKAWGTFLRKEAYVVLLRVPPRDAHSIFETLNTRGVRLSNGDKFKSHLIGRTPRPNTAAAISKWNQITASLTGAKGNYEDDLERFLLHYYGSRYGETTIPQLFIDYRREAETLDPLVALDELLESARLYRTLVDPEATDTFWAGIGPGARQAVELVNGLGLRQLRFLLLSVLRDFGAAQGAKQRRQKQRQAVIKIAAWSLRGLVLEQLGGGEAGKTYIRAASEIRHGNIQSLNKLRTFFVQRGLLVTDDSLFTEAFRRFSFARATSHNRASAVLYGLEHYKITSKAGLQPRDSLTIEHVLPKNPADGQWTDFSEDDRKVYAYRLGNLLLIDGPSRANDLLANKEWPDKRALIKTWPNQTPLTTQAVRRLKWNKETIESRTNELAMLAANAWSV